MAKKRIKNTNFFRPKNIFIKKTGEISVRNFNRFVKNFTDPYDWGNNKQHFYYKNRKYQYANLERVNASLSSPDKRLWSRYKLTERELTFHLTAADKTDLLYYTNSPLSHTPLFCFDIDNEDYTTKSDLLGAVECLSSLFPDNYWEYSSSGKGVHFYILLDLSDSKINTAFYNSILHSLGEILRVYINSFYDVKFDAIKGNYCSYNFNNKNRPYISKCGILCKLPRPISLDDYFKLYNIGFTNIDLINKVAQYITSVLNPLVELYKNNNCHYLSYLIPNYDCLLNWINTFDNKNNNNYAFLTFASFSYPPSSSSDIGMGATVPENNKNKGANIRNNTTETDANKRSLIYGWGFFRDYYKNNKTIPTLEQYRESYRQEVGTGAEDDDDKKRLKDCYELIKNKFIPDKVGKSKGVNIGEFIEDIKKLITQEEITEYILTNYPNKKNRVSIEDLDVGFGYYYKNLMQDKDDRAQKQRSFSIPYKGLIKWFKSLKDKKEYFKSCNNHKALMIRDILLHIGILKRVDSSYVPAKLIKGDKVGISQRFVITDKCCRYGEFEKYYGKEFIDSFLLMPTGTSL